MAGGIEKRLAQLERTRGGFDEARASSEVLRLMSTSDLLTIEGFLERTSEAEDEPTREEWAAIHRYEKLRQEGSQR